MEFHVNLRASADGAYLCSCGRSGQECFQAHLLQAEEEETWAPLILRAAPPVAPRSARPRGRWNPPPGRRWAPPGSGGQTDPARSPRLAS